MVEETFMLNESRGAPRSRAEKSIPQTRKTAESREVPSGRKRVAETDSSASVEHRNIPAILPYEVKEALLRDMISSDISGTMTVATAIVVIP